MSAIIDGSHSVCTPRPIANAPGGWLLRYGARLESLIPLAAAVAALAVQLMRPTNEDVSWLLTVNDRILAGATAYQGVIELNPPASILLYRIPVLLAKLLSIRAEFALDAMLALLVGGVLAYARRLISRYGLSASANNSLLLGAMGFVLAILPLDEIAQREHFATIFIIPYAFIAIARVQGARVALADSLVSGVMLGLCIAIKPHFALCVLLVVCFEIWRVRQVRPFFHPEYWAAGALMLAYVAAIPVFYPKFLTDILPQISEVYLPLRLGLGLLIVRIGVSLLVPLAICWIWRDRRQNQGTIVLLLIAAGFLGAYLIQGKGWDYHAYPVIAFCLIAAAWTMQQARDDTTLSGWRRLVPPALLAAALLLPTPRFYKPDPTEPALAAAISRLAPHPKMLAIAFPLRLGHPLTRDIGGTWVGRMWGLWATGGAFQMKARAGADPVLRARAEAYLEKDRLMLAQDIELQQPDIVLVEKLVDFDFSAWIAQSARLQAAMSHYDLAQTVGAVQIFKLRDHAAG